MKQLLSFLMVLMLAGCAGTPSPFMDGSAKLQVAGATKDMDPERVLGASYVAIKALRAGTSKSYINGLAGVLDTAANGSATNDVLENALMDFVKKKAKYPEDKMLANYFIAKLQVKTDRISLPLSPEQRRILLLYAGTLRDTAKDF